MTRSDCTLGAPVTEPGGNVARRTSASVTSGRRRPWTWETRCHSPGWGSAVGRRGATIVPYSHTRPRSLRMRSTIITCSAASLAEPRRVSSAAAADGRVGSRAIVPLIGPVTMWRPRRRRNSSGRQRGDAAAGGVERGRVGRIQVFAAAANRSVARASVSRRAGAGTGWPGRSRPPRSARRHWATASTWCSASRRRRCSGEMCGGRVGRRRARPADRCSSRRRCVERVAAAVGDQRLEPPPTVRGATQDVVVIGEVKAREGAPAGSR